MLPQTYRKGKTPRLPEQTYRKTVKINGILIFLLHLLPRMRRLKTFVTPCMVTLCNFFPVTFWFQKKKNIYVCATTFMPFFFFPTCFGLQKPNTHVYTLYDAVCTYVLTHGLTWAVLTQSQLRVRCRLQSFRQSKSMMYVYIFM